MQTIPSPRGFRGDVNGLRAWAVMAVILYHFGVPGFGGGFVGVDVFFVISGFLMTGIVIKGLEQGSFSVLAFYGARIRRIVPALLGLCFFLLVLGYAVLSPPDYKTLATHALSAISFVSNFKFWDEAGYFDISSHEKWLLHTWSLSVEWQFYLLLPLLLSAVWRLKPGRLPQIYVLLACTVISLGLSVALTDSYPTTAFFLLPMRAWEMLAGGVVFIFSPALRPAEASRRWMESGGFALVVMSILIFDMESSWPGWRATVPVLGAMMILLANIQGSLWAGGRLAQWLGDRSYSLYLWHWPVFVALVYGELHRAYWAVAIGIALTMILGDISSRWVENPSRRFLGQAKSFHFAAILILALLVVALPALTVRLMNGVGGRLPPVVEKVAAESNNFNSRANECHAYKGNVSPSCVWGGGEWKVIALGDSHLSVAVPAIASVQESAGVVQWSYSGCSFILGVKINQVNIGKLGSDYQCERFVEWAKSQLAILPTQLPVVILNRYALQAFGPNEINSESERPRVYFSKIHHRASPEFLEEFGERIVDTACEIAKQRRVYLVRPIPEMGFDVPKTLSRRLALGLKEDVSISLDDYRKRNQWVWAAQDAAAKRCGVRILDPLPYLCDASRCYGSRNLQALYMDSNHLSETGNKLLTPMFQSVFDESR